MVNRVELAQAVAAHGTVVRVVVCAVQGSTPREAGAAMLVWAQGQSGTIGGGALEFEAAARARKMLTAVNFGAATWRVPLGPTMGQCCGGAVVLGMERFDAAALDAVPSTGLFLRPLGTDKPLPLRLHRLRADARAQGMMGLRYEGGWLAEPVMPPARPLWLWGAGHVGRAIAATLAPLPGMAITWVDTGADRFPAEIPAGVTPRMAENPADLVAQAPRAAQHLILTYSHALDLELCHRLLNHGFDTCGLIGSETKWARFRSRLAALGHAPAAISRIQCPIGDPSFGKHPQAIAISVAAAFLGAQRTHQTLPERTAL